MSNSIKPIAAALGAAFLASSFTPAVSAESNPFSAQQLSGGYDLASYGKDAEGTCGDKKKAEGSCGDKKKAEGKCGDKKAEGTCGDKKKAEGKCGEGKCGANKKAMMEKKAEGSCGEAHKADSEGKCGGSK